MRVQVMIVALGSFLLLAAGCGGTRNEGGGAPVTPPQEEAASSAPQEEEMTLTGTLAKTVEAGGWILRTSSKTYLLLSAERYRQESWFREGVRVKVTGKESPGTITIFMQGTPFRVSSMEPEA